MQLRLLLFVSVFAALGVSDDLSSNVSGTNCTLQASPDRFLSAQGRIREQIFQSTRRFQQAAAAMATKSAAATAPIPHRSFIDDEIFNKLASAKVQPARLTTDEEFFRRINFDLTGRIPSPDDVRAFAANTDPRKRDAAIEQLLNSAAFNDKWTFWLGDLLQNTVTEATVAVNRQIEYPAQSTSDFYNNSSMVTDAVTTAEYDLNTNYGNRPNRVPFGTTKTLTPVYHLTGATPADGNWRNAFALLLISNQMFARNVANPLWKACSIWDWWIPKRCTKEVLR